MKRKQDGRRNNGAIKGGIEGKADLVRLPIWT